MIKYSTQGEAIASVIMYMVCKLLKLDLSRLLE